MIHNRGLTSCLPDFILTEEQRKDMSLEHQLKDLNEKLEMTQAIRHRGKYIEVLFNAVRMNTDQFVLGLVTIDKSFSRLGKTWTVDFNRCIRSCKRFLSRTKCIVLFLQLQNPEFTCSISTYAD